MKRAPLRVLIVDDNVEAAELLQVSIERRGHSTRVAHDVDEALRVAAAFRPQVALLDLMIRCESGYFLGREIRSIPGLESCQLLAMTGFAQEQHRRASVIAGFQHHLIKPIVASELFEAIEAANGGRVTLE